MLIPAADQANWILTDALAVSDRGDIAGVGFFNDGTTSGGRGFLLIRNQSTSQVPEPSGWLLMLIAAIPAVVVAVLSVSYRSVPYQEEAAP